MSEKIPVYPASPSVKSHRNISGSADPGTVFLSLHALIISCNQCRDTFFTSSCDSLGKSALLSRTFLWKYECSRGMGQWEITNNLIDVKSLNMVKKCITKISISVWQEVVSKRISSMQFLIHWSIGLKWKQIFISISISISKYVSIQSNSKCVNETWDEMVQLFSWVHK